MANELMRFPSGVVFKVLSARNVVEVFKEIYDADVLAQLVSKVTERVLDQVIEWQGRSTIIPAISRPRETVVCPLIVDMIR